jgi:glycosyltransferase involved in cell wall biosynthesis
MTFTVITVSYNGGKTIKKAIESVLNQTYSNFEYVIIDGNSNDNTLSIIKSFEPLFKEKGISYKWISEKDSGIYDAWNKGVNLATGKWISFLGSDDYYIKNALEAYYETISNNKNVDYDFVHSNVKLVNGEKVVKIYNRTWSWKQFKRNMSIPHVGGFHNSKYFETYGLFDASYKVAGDYEMLLRAKQNLKVLKVGQQLVIMSAGGVSNSQIKKVFKETYKAKNKTAGVHKLVCLCDYVMAFVKYIIKKIVYAFH